MKPFGVQFGAGNIGRGFIGHLLWQSGMSVVFVEVDEELVRALRERKSYPLRLLEKDGTLKDIVIDDIEAFSPKEEDEVAQRIALSSLVFTAVGVRNLAGVASLLAKGLERRREKNPRELNVFLCENLKNAPDLLRGEVSRFLSLEGQKFLKEKVGFVGTVAARMVPVVGERFGVLDPLCIVAESYSRLPFDLRALRGAIPQVFGLEGTEYFEAEVERKLFLHNMGHAILAYLGYLRGYAFIHEAIKDREIAEVFEGAWREVSLAFLRKYPFWDREEHKTYLVDLKERFANPALMDTVERVGRDPLRKLSPQDRLVGGALFCLAWEVFPAFIARGCAAALLYDYKNDQEAVMLQKMLAEKGVEGVLREVCGVDPGSPFGKEVVQWYSALQRVKTGGVLHEESRKSGSFGGE